jgi:putative transposase
VKLRRRLRQIAESHPRWGWKNAHEVLVREGFARNKKRTRRLWRAKGLHRPQRCTERRRLYPRSAERRA